MMDNKPNPGLLDTEALMAWSGINQKAALRRWLDEDPPIPYKLRRDGGVCTTLDAVTEALQGRAESAAWVA